MLKFVIILECLAIFAMAQWDNCNVERRLSVGEILHIRSPQYPSRYPGGTQCRWTLIAEEGCTIDLNCEDVNIPISVECDNDRIEVSQSGRSDLADAQKYCAVDWVRVRSDSNSNRLVLALIATARSNGGSFACTATVNSGRRI